ncbi:protein LONGIFOLIA 2-like [Benincasa hispida]|uniref:protein LONGIFOLIA 2-like n=1 Tax=Benincasa hispida TaxID=102211 RepID=UPI00190188A4|nr:protein LONGIFOLIA 2-like [Benincasa hispida]
MAAKLLHSLADDNPDLRKQIGCMTGIFHLFDRHNAITTKRISHKRLPPGHSQSNGGDLVSTAHQQEKPNESSLNENVNDKQSMPAESSRDSLSSCSSSLSSLECNKTARLEALSFSRTIVLESPSTGLTLNQLNTASYSERQPFNIKHVVKDSMHREVRTSFVKMTDMDDFGHGAKHRDSPRPPPMSKCAEVSSRVARNHNQDAPIDIKESFRVLAELKDTSWNFDEATGRPRSSCENEATHGKNLLSRDFPRLSYDGRERSQCSYESSNLKSSPKLKELPRLSLDSRETSGCRNFQNSSCSTDKSSELHHSSGNQKRLPSVVAKLMGLETLPDAFSSIDTQCGGETFAKSLRSRNLKTSASDKSSSKCSTSPRRKYHDLIRKPIQSSRLPVETAPWRKLDGTQVTKSTALRPVKGPAPSSSPAVYDEVEMRLKDLEFEQSSKDLRALKKILEAIQIRALSEIGIEEKTSVVGIQRNQEPSSSRPNQKTRLMSQRNRRSSVVASTASVPNSSKAYESSIIIMRPTKPVEKSVVSTSTIQMDRSPILHKLQNEGFPDNKKGSTNGQTGARYPKSSQKDLAVITSEKKSISRNIRSPQTSSKAQLVLKESNTSSMKSSDAVSPRLRHGKVEVEKRSHPTKSDAYKPKRKMKQTDSSAHCGKIKPKTSSVRQCDDQSSEMNNEPRVSSYQRDDMTLQSDTSLSLDSKIGIEVNSSMQSTEIDDSQRQAMEAVEFLTPGSVKKLSMVASSQDGLTVEQDAIALEHPSPVSVLDAPSLYRDDEASPVKKITISLHGDDSLDPNERRSEDQCNISDDIFVNPLVLNHNVEIDSMKFENIEDLIQKLGCLNSHHDEGEKDYIGLLCENANPDHRYISEILLASGLLHRDLGHGLTTFQLHPSGNPIDPELFFVLEKTEVGGVPPKEGFSPARASYSNREKVDRKLIFDAVNEMLIEKLAIDGGAPEPWLKPTKIAKEAFSGPKILKQLCNEIEQFQAKKFRCNLDVEKDDSMSILQDDVMRQSRSWTDFRGDIYDVVLDVERSIFKDLVNEIIIW